MPVTHSREQVAMKYFVSSVTGIIFGLALEKGRVFEPIIIREQMLLSNFTMLKMFLSASASGMLSFSVLAMIPATSKKMEKALDEFIKGLETKTVAFAAVGGALLGCGMSLAGACPGMVWIQVGASVPNSAYTLLGAACGVYLYAFTEVSMPCQVCAKHKPDYHTLDEYLDTPYFNIALPMAAVLGTAVFALDLYAPWQTEVEVSGEGILGVTAWPPYVSGALIGLLQIPIVLVIGDTLGTATGMMTLAAQTLVIPKVKKIAGTLKRFKSGVSNWWQVFFMAGAVAGAYVSANASNTRGTVKGVSPLFGFGGGLLLLYGSRLAGGCTSGHGLSGMGLMSLLSFVAVPAMFGAGILTSVLLKYGLEIDIDQL